MRATPIYFKREDGTQVFLSINEGSYSWDDEPGKKYPDIQMAINSRRDVKDRSFGYVLPKKKTHENKSL